MNAYTTVDRARMQPREITAVRRADGCTVGASFVALQWQRGWQAESEVDWLLKQNCGTPHSSTSPVAMLRRAIGAALIRAGEGLAGTPRTAASPQGAQ